MVGVLPWLRTLDYMPNKGTGPDELPETTMSVSYTSQGQS